MMAYSDTSVSRISAKIVACCEELVRELETVGMAILGGGLRCTLFPVAGLHSQNWAEP